MTQAAFEERITALTETLYRVSATLLPRPCDRQDAVQSCILKAWRHCGGVRDERAFRPWLIRILINECYTLLRKGKRMVLAEPPENGYDPHSAQARDQDLRDAIDALPEKQRLAVVLHYIEDASVEEIAKALRIPVGTVKSRLSAARAALRSALREEVEA